MSFLSKMATIRYLLNAHRNGDSIINVFFWIYITYFAKEKYPWLTINAIKWLNQNLRKDMIVFEYGSGNSTFYYSRKVKNVYSVEHDISWYKHISNMPPPNVNILLVEPRNIASTESLTGIVRSKSSGYEKYDFVDYVNAINNYSTLQFDLVIVDGRARVACIKNALSRIKNNGYLILDNSEREEYKEAHLFLAEYKKFSFNGMVPFSRAISQTTVWQIC